MKSDWYDAHKFTESSDAYVMWHSISCYVEAAIAFLLFCVYMDFGDRKYSEEPDAESSTDEDTDY